MNRKDNTQSIEIPKIEFFLTYNYIRHMVFYMLILTDFRRKTI